LPPGESGWQAPIGGSTRGTTGASIACKGAAANFTAPSGKAPPDSRSRRESLVGESSPGSVRRVGLHAVVVRRRRAGPIGPEDRLAIGGIRLGVVVAEQFSPRSRSPGSASACWRRAPGCPEAWPIPMPALTPNATACPAFA